MRRVREEAALKKALDEFLQRHAAALAGLPPAEVRSKVRQFVAAEKSAGRLALSADDPTPILWWIRNALHLIGIPLLLLVALPLLVVIAPIYVVLLRHLEKTDPELCGRVDQAYSDALRECNTEAAPWYAVPADRKWYRNWAVTKILAEQLEEIGDHEREEAGGKDLHCASAGP